MTGVLLLPMRGGAMLTDGAWMDLEPLIEACRPKGKTAPKDLRRTISAIVWRHQNGAKWRAIPAELGPWSRAAQTHRVARVGIAGALAPPPSGVKRCGRNSGVRTPACGSGPGPPRPSPSPDARPYASAARPRSRA